MRWHIHVGFARVHLVGMLLKDHVNHTLISGSGSQVVIQAAANITSHKRTQDVPMPAPPMV